MPKCKGSGVLETIAFILKRFGAQGLEKVKAALPPRDRALLFDREILPISWVDALALIHLEKQMDQVLGKGDKQLLRTLQHCIAEKHITGIYKFFVNLVSPAFLLKKVIPLYRQYNDTGDVSVTASTPHSVSFRVDNFPDMPEGYLDGILFYFEKLLMLAGAKDVTFEKPRCLSRGDACTLCEFRWK